MGEDNGGGNSETIILPQVLSELRGIHDANARLIDMERQLGKLWTEIAELKGELQRLREAEQERKQLKRDAWATAMRVAVTALAGGVVGWLVLGFKESVK